MWNEDTHTRNLSQCSPLCEYSALEYVRMHAIYKVPQAEYAYLYSCDCTTVIREYVFPMQGRESSGPLPQVEGRDPREAEFLYPSRRPLPVSPRPPSGIDTSRCWARQCRRTGETPVFCTSVCVCVCDPRDAAVTCPARRGCHSCDGICRCRYISA